MFLRSDFRWWHKKKITIPIFLLLIVLIIRIILSPILLKKFNQLGAEASPLYKIHIYNLDLGFIRGALVAKGVSVNLKSSGRKFLDVKKVDISIAWRELLKGRALLDVYINSFNLLVSKDLMTSFSAFKKDADKQEDKLPIKIEKVNVEDSKITLLDYPGLTNQEHLTVNEINARLTNITPTKKFPFAFYTASATIVGKSNIHVVGKFNPLEKPKVWDMDFELKKFDLTDANKILRDQIPVTFKRGTLDIYAEATSKKNTIRGYIKPFMSDVEVIGKNENFKGAKHFIIEVIGEVSNYIFEEEKTKSVATKIPFIYDGKFKVESGEALEKVIQHGFTEKLDHGIENLYELK